MENVIKLIITEDAGEFSDENLKMLQILIFLPPFALRTETNFAKEFSREKPDVVLMDSFMTRLDATELCATSKDKI